MPVHRYYVDERAEAWIVRTSDDSEIPCETLDAALRTAKTVARRNHRHGDLSEILVPDVYGTYMPEWSCGLDCEDAEH